MDQLPTNFQPYLWPKIISPHPTAHFSAETLTGCFDFSVFHDRFINDVFTKVHYMCSFFPNVCFGMSRPTTRLSWRPEKVVFFCHKIERLLIFSRYLQHNDLLSNLIINLRLKTVHWMTEVFHGSIIRQLWLWFMFYFDRNEMVSHVLRKSLLHHIPFLPFPQLFTPVQFKMWSRPCPWLQLTPLECFYSNTPHPLLLRYLKITF